MLLRRISGCRRGPTAIDLALGTTWSEGVQPGPQKGVLPCERWYAAAGYMAEQEVHPPPHLPFPTCNQFIGGRAVLARCQVGATGLLPR